MSDTVCDPADLSHSFLIFLISVKKYVIFWLSCKTWRCSFWFNSRFYRIYFKIRFGSCEKSRIFFISNLAFVINLEVAYFACSLSIYVEYSYWNHSILTWVEKVSVSLKYLNGNFISNIEIDVSFMEGTDCDTKCPHVLKLLEIRKCNRPTRLHKEITSFMPTLILVSTFFFRTPLAKTSHCNTIYLRFEFLSRQVALFVRI